MTSDRDQPEYGERATPEEQARAIAQSGGVQEWQRRAAFPPAAERATPQPQGVPARSATYSLNRFITILLLGIGFVAVIQSVFGYLDLAATIQTLYAQQGIGEYAATELTSAVGIALVVTHALLWAITTWISLRVLARGRTAWWIPLVGATVTFIVMATLFALLLLSDPVFIAYIGAA